MKTIELIVSSYHSLIVVIGMAVIGCAGWLLNRIIGSVSGKRLETTLDPIRKDISDIRRDLHLLVVNMWQNAKTLPVGADVMQQEDTQPDTKHPH